MPKAPLIVLLTDYGNLDPFVGIVKGVLAKIAPGIPLVDLTHEIPPGDIKRGAVVLWQAFPYFPQGTIFLGIVDPGVGTSRKSIIVDNGNARFVGPDNGLFTFVIQSGYRAWEINNPEYLLPTIGDTFHGRDVFAPVSGHAASGISPEKFGKFIPEIKIIPPPRLEIIDRTSIRGEILFPDGFGNILTSLGRFIQQADQKYLYVPWLDTNSGVDSPLYFSSENAHLLLPDGQALSWVRTFADVPVDECAFLVGGSGLIEIVSNRSSAAQILDLEESSTITLSTGGA